MIKGRHSVRKLLYFMRPYRVSLVISIFLVAISAILNAVFPLLFSAVVDYIKDHVNFDGANGITDTIDYGALWLWVLEIGGVILVAQGALYFGSRLSTRLIQQTMRTLRSKVTEKLNYLPVAFFDRHKQGTILSRITNDIDNIGNALQQSFITILNAIFMLIFVAIALFTLSWQIALLTLFIVPASVFITKFITKRSQSSFDELQKALGDLNGFIQEDYSGFEVIKVYGQESASVKEFEKVAGTVTKHGFAGGFLSSLISPLSGFVTYAVYITISVYGAYLIIDGNVNGYTVMTIGGLQACIQCVWNISNSVSQIIELVPNMQIVSAATVRVFEILDEPNEPDEKGKIHFPAQIQGGVSFKDVSFRYVPDKPLIDDLSFDVKPGQTVAIVGPTGAGKTTIVNLLMRFYDIDQGIISIDNISTLAVSRHEVRKQFGMVLQDAWLYQASIRENIRFGRLDASNEEVVQAAKIANVHEFILSLPDGYDTILNEETSNISQGQKQLLTLARVVIANPKILILDEATSSVDTRIELLIQDAMQNVMQGRTSFVIAHRLSTIKSADLILVIKDGSIIEKGTHKTLLKQKGFYEELYNSQFAE